MTDLIGKIKALIITGILALPINSISNMYYTQFTADSHIQMRPSADIVEEVYYMDSNSDGRIDQIKTYAGTASRGITIVPFTYTPDDDRFEELLNLRHRDNKTHRTQL